MLLLCLIARPKSNEDYDFYLKKCDQRPKLELDSLMYYGKLLKTSKNQYLQNYGLLQEANVYYAKRNYDTCESILRHIIKDIEIYPKPESYTHTPSMAFSTYEESIKHIKINVYRRFFYLKKRQQDYDEALLYLNRRNQVVESLKTKDSYYLKNLIQVKRGLAVLKRQLGRYRESVLILRKLHEEINLIPVSNHRINKTHLLQEKALIELEIVDGYIQTSFTTDGAIDSSDFFLDLFYATALSYDTLPDNIRGHTRTYLLKKALLATYRKDYQKTLDLIQECKKHQKEKIEEEDYYFLKTIAYGHFAEYDSSIHYGTLYINKFKYDRLSNRFQIYNVLAKSYIESNKEDSAFKYSQLALKNIQEYRNEEKRTTDLLQKESIKEVESIHRKVLKEKNSRQNSIIIIALTIIIAIVVVVFYLYKRRNLVTKQYKKLALEYEDLKTTVDNTPESPKPSTLKPVQYINPIVQAVPIQQNNKEKATTPPTEPKKVEIKDQHTIQILEGLQRIENSRLFLDKDFSLPVLAKLLESNTTYVSKVINDHIGKSFKEYLMELRMNILLKDLEEKPIIRKYSIEALADYTGYTNASSFSRAFKKKFDISPSKYLKEKYG